jgi:hypothetical protein
MKRKPSGIDIRVQDHGSIVLLWPDTDRAKEWVEANVAYEQTWGHAIVVEPRYLGDIVEGARNDGLGVA